MAIPAPARPVVNGAQSPVAQAPVGPVTGIQHLCLDIETGDAPKEAIALAQQFWKAPANMKDPAKIKEREVAAMASIEEKSALLDAAPIMVLGVVTENSAVLFHSIKSKKKVVAIKGIAAEIFHFKTERDLLAAFRDWVDARSLPNTVMIGHNIIRFDLPKLRGGYLRNRLVMPKVLRPEAREGGVEVFDTMPNFLRYFTTELFGDIFISQEEMVARLGIPGHKHRLSGAEIPRMIREGKADEVLAYNCLDTTEAYAAYLAMTGQYKDQAA